MPVYGQVSRNSTRLLITSERHASCVNFLPPPDDVAFLQTAHDIYLQQQRYPEALALAIRLSDPKLIATDFRTPGNP